MELQEKVLTCCRPGCAVKSLYWSEEEKKGVCIRHWQDEEGDMRIVWRITDQSGEDFLKCRDECMEQIEKWKENQNNSCDKSADPELLEKILNIIKENFDKLEEYLDNEEICKFSEANNECKCKLSSDQISNARELPPHQGYMPYLDPETLFELVSISIEGIENESSLQDSALKEDIQNISDKNIQDVISKPNSIIKNILKEKILLPPEEWKMFSRRFKKLEKKGVIKLTGNFHYQSLFKTFCFEMTSSAFKEYLKQFNRSMLMDSSNPKLLVYFMLFISFRRVARLQNIEKLPESDRAKLLTTDNKFFFQRIFEFRKKEENIQKNIYYKTLPKDNDETLPCEHDDCQLPSFYYLPEYEIKLCFLHRFHSDYKDLSKCICLQPHNLFETFKITKNPIPKDVRQSLLINANMMIGKDIVLKDIYYFKEFIQNEVLLNCFEKKKYPKNELPNDSLYFDDELVSNLWNTYDKNKNSYSLSHHLNAHKFSQAQKEDKLRIIVCEDVYKNPESLDKIKKYLENEEDDFEENCENQILQLKDFDDSNNNPKSNAVDIQSEISSIKPFNKHSTMSFQNRPESSKKIPSNDYCLLKNSKNYQKLTEKGETPPDNLPNQNHEPSAKEESKHPEEINNEDESISDSSEKSTLTASTLTASNKSEQSNRTFIAPLSLQNASINSLSNHMEQTSNADKLQQEESKDRGNDLVKINVDKEEELDDIGQINRKFADSERNMKLDYDFFLKEKKRYYEEEEKKQKIDDQMYYDAYDSDYEEERFEKYVGKYNEKYPEKAKEIINENKLIIDFSIKEDYEFIKECKDKIKVNKIEFSNVPKEDEHILLYLLKCFPKSCDSFTIKFAKT
ncbi:unnamed protein product [Moneuplotes crassus]|uniref:Uncharacterized protein n=1 Tax=Euplotes crassus TaxID=5936 RepID=A0AAD1Y6T6_EUPCR|nr:unnamed protein product [Moneuplotes crassus]